MKESKKISHYLSVINKTFDGQIRLGYTTRVCIPDIINIDMFAFEAETGDKKSIYNDCIAIIKMYETLPKIHKINQVIYYQEVHLTKAFFLAEKDGYNNWKVLNGIFDYSISKEANKNIIHSVVNLHWKINNETITNNHNLIYLVREILKIVEGTTEPPAGTTLHTDLELVRLDHLYNYLSDEELIKTTPEMWRYWFTQQSLQAGKQPKKIQWLGAGSVLSNVIMLVCGNFTNHTKTAIEAAFKLQSGTNYQRPTQNRNNRGKYPYKRIYEIMEHAETKL